MMPMRPEPLQLVGYIMDARGREYARYRRPSTGEVREVMVRPGPGEPRYLTEAQAREVAAQLMRGERPGPAYRTVLNLGRAAPIDRARHGGR